MKTISTIAVLVLLTAMSGVALSADEKAETYIYATYLYCDSGQVEQLDEHAKGDVSALNAAVKDGVITGWGWMAHQTGGQWRRLSYHTGPSVSAVLSAVDALATRTEAANPVPDENASICPSHDDYIWRAVAGKGSDTRGKVGFSTYLVCDSSREARADEITESFFKPILNKLVDDKMINSWGWNEHIVGGEYRRLMTLSAADVGSLMKARGAFVEKISDKPLATEFDAICGSHSDYIWEIQQESTAAE